MNRFCLLLGVSVLVTSARMTAASPDVKATATVTRPAGSAVPTCAVLADAATTKNEPSLVSLLEVKLSEDKHLRVVERAEIDKVLKEQELSAAFAADAVGRRCRLGALLKADLLAFLRERTGKEKDARAIELVVADTRRGLRLIVQIAVWDPNNAEAIAGSFVQTVRKAGATAQRDDLRVWAVFPFESQDVGFQYGYLRRSCARVMEESLMRVPGAAVIETVEAKALAQEMAISGQTVVRDLPYYIFGSYKTTQSESGRRVSLTVELRHGAESLTTISRDDVPQEEVGPGLQAVVSEFLLRTASRGPATLPPGIEAKLLAERAAVFARIGDWEEAVPLYESVLLLDPGDPGAYTQLFAGHTQLMFDPPGLRSRRGDAYSAAQLPYAEAALDHLEPLLRRTQVNDELLRLMLRFHVYSNTALMTQKGAPAELRSACMRFGRRRTQMALDLLVDPERQAVLSNGQIETLALYLSWCATAQARLDPEYAFDVVYRLLETMDGRTVSIPVLLYHATWIGWHQQDHDEAYLGLLGRLEQSASARLRLTGRASRILYRIRDRETFDVVCAELTQFASSNPPFNEVANHLHTLAEQRLQMVLGRNGMLAAKRSVMVPAFTPIDGLPPHAKPRSAPSRPFMRIEAWASCGPDIDLVATDRGVYRLGDDRQFAKLHPAIAHELLWDGRYVWTMNPAGGEPLVVLDPLRGEVARFERSEIGEEAGLERSGLAAIRPGLACYLGRIRRDDGARHSWAALLEVEPGTEPKRKHAEIFFEARKQADPAWRDVAPPPDTAFYPAWALTIVGNQRGRGPFVVVGGPQWPLVLDVSRKTASVPTGSWPKRARMAEYEGQFYIGAGHLGSFRDNSAVYRLSNVDDEVKRLVDFGERPSEAINWPAEPYYASVTVFGRKLHLLSAAEVRTQMAAPRAPASIPGARRFETVTSTKVTRGVPAWSAVDLDTLETSLLVDVFPDEFPLDRPHELCVSSRYGLVLLSGGRAYRVELPPAETWPHLEAKVVATRPTTRPGAVGSR